MNSESSPSNASPEPDYACEACGRPGAVRIGERLLCTECISAAGSCCAEFGAWDAWSSDGGAAPRSFSNEAHVPSENRRESTVRGSVTHDQNAGRFEIYGESKAPAFLEYIFEGNRVVFNHTYVPNELRRRGIAARLVREALEEARRAGWRIVPACSYVAAFVQRHPEFSDLIDRPTQS